MEKELVNALKEAVIEVAESIDPHGDLDGATLLLENILQKVYQFNGMRGPKLFEVCVRDFDYNTDFCDFC